MRWAYSLDPGGAPGGHCIGGYLRCYGLQDALKPKARPAGALSEAFERVAASLEGQ